MPNEVLVKDGTKIAFGVSGSFSPAAPGTDWTDGGAITHALTLAALADGAARQSIKVDLGATRARFYSLFGCVDYTGLTPGVAVDDRIEYYWAPSTSGTQGRGNVAGNSGADAPAPDGAVGVNSLAEFLAMCELIGYLDVSNDGAVQNGFIGIFEPPARYGQLILVNNGGAAFAASDVQANQVLVPIIDEVQ